MPQLSFPQVTRPTSLERVHFRDGMIVHADDLDSAVRYPVDMFRMLVRAFFGCGIVCGLEVHPKQSQENRLQQQSDPDCDDAFSVIIKPGVAVDCAGYPLELCREVVVNLMPGPSSCRKPKGVCLLIRRLTTEESSRRPCGCGDEPSSDDACGVRVREHVQIKVFDNDSPPACVCRHEKPQEAAEGDWPDERTRICKCLRTCGPCTCGSDACCDDGWVLLACVNFTLEGDQPTGLEPLDLSRRRYVKPIDCLCRCDTPEEQPEPCPPADNGGANGGDAGGGNGGEQNQSERPAQRRHAARQRRT